MRIHTAFTIILMASLMVFLMAMGGACDHRKKRSGSNSKSSLSTGEGTGVDSAGKGPAPVELGTAGSFVILAKSGLSNVPTSTITGDLGLSHAAASFFTGFSLMMDGSNTFATASQVTGKLFAADFTEPTPTNLTTAVFDMETAYADAAGRAADYTDLGEGNIGGKTLPPAVYRWGTSVLIATDVTLEGGPNDVWIFQIGQDLTMSSAMQIILSGGAKPENIFWQVFGVVEIGTTAHFEGIILSRTSISFNAGASLNGRLLAQTAVKLDSNGISAP
jgi:hypothetical protein